MTLSTLVVCNAGADKLSEIQGLVGSNPGLVLVGTVTMNESFAKVEQSKPSLVWIELTPDPDEGVKLLVGLKERYPEIYYLVSNDALDADLVKMTMQMGAIDFLDAQTWKDQLPDVVSRIKIKENAQIEARERQEAERLKMKEALEQQRSSNPTVSKTNFRSMKRMVTDTKELESRAAMNLTLLLVLAALAAGVLFWLNH
ncbi:MAG: hypothetical protein K2X93_23115 [Candidatus Obscuribacterales bacterium]|nr:hypothetical protein [Candidatus Obscuribacterales bacterium]